MKTICVERLKRPAAAAETGYQSSAQGRLTKRGPLPRRLEIGCCSIASRPSRKRSAEKAPFRGEARVGYKPAGPVLLGNTIEDNPMIVSPYGSWASPIASDL